ncbi:MAG: CRISPR-associated protein Cas4 [Clostridia bacterium]
MEYNEQDFLMISGIQHFLFCKRQWALIHIENGWVDNIHTVEGDIMHEKVHDSTKNELRKDIFTTRGMNIFSKKLGVSGQCDVVEFRQSNDGINLQNKSGKWIPYPIEYKKGSSKITDIDRVQLCAQAMCLEEMLCCEIDQGALFYGETRKREVVDFDNELRDLVANLFSQMHELYKKGYTPKVKTTKSCNACSLKEICVPKLMRNKNVSNYIASFLKEDDDL